MHLPEFVFDVHAHAALEDVLELFSLRDEVIEVRTREGRRFHTMLSAIGDFGNRRVRVPAVGRDADGATILVMQETDEGARHGGRLRIRLDEVERLTVCG